MVCGGGETNPLPPQGMMSNPLGGVEGSFNYGEVNNFGLLFLSKTFDNVMAISLDELQSELTPFIKSAIIFYEKFGYFGVVKITFSFHNMIETRAIPHKTGAKQPSKIIDKSFSSDIKLPLQSLSEDRENQSVQLTKDIAWNLDISDPDESKIALNAKI